MPEEVGPAPLTPITLGAGEALASILAAFRSLQNEGAKIQTRDIGGVPVLSSADPGTVFTFLWSLSNLDFLQFPPALSPGFGTGISQVLDSLTSNSFLYSKDTDRFALLSDAFHNFELCLP